MFKNLDSKLNLSLTLAIVAAVSALLLTLVNNLTSVVIEENQLEKQATLYNELFSDLESYEAVDTNTDEYDLIKVSNGKEDVGFVCTTDGDNAYGSITVLVGIDNSGEIVGIKYSSFNQTPGFGDKIKDNDYIKQYIGSDVANTNVEFASGATYSSTLLDELVSNCKQAI